MSGSLSKSFTNHLGLVKDLYSRHFLIQLPNHRVITRTTVQDNPQQAQGWCGWYRQLMPRYGLIRSVVSPFGVCCPCLRGILLHIVVLVSSGLRKQRKPCGNRVPLSYLRKLNIILECNLSNQTFSRLFPDHDTLFLFTTRLSLSHMSRRTGTQPLLIKKHTPRPSSSSDDDDLFYLPEFYFYDSDAASSDSEPDSDSEWYSKELSKTILRSPIQSSYPLWQTPARPDSMYISTTEISISPTSKRRVSKPLPPIPLSSSPSTFPRRRGSKRRAKYLPLPPVPIISSPSFLGLPSSSSSSCFSAEIAQGLEQLRRSSPDVQTPPIWSATTTESLPIVSEIREPGRQAVVKQQQVFDYMSSSPFFPSCRPTSPSSHLHITEKSRWSASTVVSIREEHESHRGLSKLQLYLTGNSPLKANKQASKQTSTIATMTTTTTTNPFSSFSPQKRRKTHTVSASVSSPLHPTGPRSPSKAPRIHVRAYSNVM